MRPSFKLHSYVVASFLFASIQLSAASLTNIVEAKPLPSIEQKESNFAKNEVIVTFKKDAKVFEDTLKGLPLASFNDFMRNFNKKFKDTLNQYFSKNSFSVKGYNQLGAMHFKSKQDSTEKLLAFFQSDAMKEYVESVSPNNIMTLTSTNDSDYGKLWAIENRGQEVNNKTGTNDAEMDVTEAWNKTKGSQDVIVAVLDTGVDYSHSDLQDNMWNGLAKHGLDFAGDDDGNNDDDPMPDEPYDEKGHYHGTHVAGIIGAVGDNGTGITGVAQHISIMALKVFRPNGYGYTNDILEALDYVSEQVKNGANIVAINASYGGSGGSQDDATNKAIKKLEKQGVIFCAAAGNEGKNIDTEPSYPAAYDAENIIAVAASDQDDKLASFSNYGANNVDVVAPGTNILSTFPENKYAYLQGTSMATPNVAGSVALIASLYADSTVAERKSMILDNVDKKETFKQKVLTEGRVNINAALTDAPEDQNSAPEAENDSATTAYETSVTIEVLNNDSDKDHDTLTITKIDKPQNGSVKIEDEKIIYTPNKKFSGEDTFNYTISDGKLEASALVTINVKEKPNTAPIAEDDVTTTEYGKSVTIDVLQNDTDKDSDKLTITKVNKPKNGSAKIDNNKILYTPNNNFSGEEKFDYSISDGKVETTATITVTVKKKKEAINHAPNAVKDTTSTPYETAIEIDVLANDSDEDGDKLNIMNITNPAEGSTKIDNGKIIYSPNKGFSGEDTFSYNISDGEYESTATVEVTVKKKKKQIQLPIFGRGFSRGDWKSVDFSTQLVHFSTKEGTNINMESDNKHQLKGSIKRGNKESRLTINIPNALMKVNAEGATIIQNKEKNIRIEIDSKGLITLKLPSFKNAVLPKEPFPIGTDLFINNHSVKFTLPLSKNIHF